MPRALRIRETENTPSGRWSSPSKQLFNWWVTARGSREFVLRRTFDPADWRRILPNIWMLDIQSDPLRLRLRLVGTAVAELMKGDYTGRWLDEVLPFLSKDEEFQARYRSVIETGEPAWKIGSIALQPDANYKISETLILPLSSNGRSTDMLLMFSSIRAML